MKTYLLLSHNKPFITKKTKDFINKLKISDFDLFEYETEEKLGIENVREIIKKSITRPYSGINKLTVIKNFHTATIEAQNAILKFLEEQPEFLTIILIAPNKQNILETVLSRTQIIQDTSKKKLGEIDLPEILTSSKGQRLAYIQKNITTKEAAMKFLSNLTSTLEQNLFTPSNLNREQAADLIKKTEKARSYLESNLNFKHVLDILLLGFPNI